MVGPASRNRYNFPVNVNSPDCPLPRTRPIQACHHGSFQKSHVLSATVHYPDRCDDFLPLKHPHNRHLKSEQPSTCSDIQRSRRRHGRRFAHSTSPAGILHGKRKIIPRMASSRSQGPSSTARANGELQRGGPSTTLRTTGTGGLTMGEGRRTE